MKNHVVNKVTIMLPAADFENARVIQQSAQRWSSHYLPDLLEKSLLDVTKNDEYYFIDKVEIELTKFPWQLTEAEWKEILIKQITQYRNSGLPVEIIINQWLFFLRKGVFERNAIINDIRELEIYLFSVISTLSQSVIIRLYQIFSSVNIAKRFFSVHSTKLVLSILVIVFQVNENQSYKVYRVIKNDLTQNPVKAIETLQYILQQIRQNKPQIKDKLIELLIINEGIQQINEIIDSENILLQTDESNTDVSNFNVYLNCPNAGLVILLPFLKRFFENIQLVKDDDFVDEISQVKAVQALHFLVTGNRVESEQEILLPKILCGFEIEEYIESFDDVDQHVKNEADELLKSVVEHWKILQNTSVESLRETFLKRDGRLKTGSNYLLQVSNSGVDVLLDKIPWGFRNFKLPWMKKSIITEWF